MINMLQQLQNDVKKLSDPKKAEILQRFFKTGKGQYGEGDVFVGLVVPQSRLLAKKYSDLSLSGITTLLDSKVHEERIIALFILVNRFEQADEGQKKELYAFYLKHREAVNNWDLVDLSASQIVGAYLYTKEKQKLYDLAKSENLWERRTAIIATLYFIRRKQFDDTFKIATLLLSDTHDLLHKAVGWMLREVGKRDFQALDRYLKENYKKMSRTTLRYALEHYSSDKRLGYMKGIV